MRHLTTAFVLIVTFFSQGSWALAGVTGGLTGTVVDADTGAPIAGAKVVRDQPLADGYRHRPTPRDTLAF